RTLRLGGIAGIATILCATLMVAGTWYVLSPTTLRIALPPGGEAGVMRVLAERLDRRATEGPPPTVAGGAIRARRGTQPPGHARRQGRSRGGAAGCPLPRQWRNGRNSSARGDHSPVPHPRKSGVAAERQAGRRPHQPDIGRGADQADSRALPGDGGERHGAGA